MEATALSAGKKEIIVDKDEITKMPQGMSSEELDALTTGEEVEEPEVKEAAEKESSPAEESVEEKPEAEEKVEKEVEEEPELSESEKQIVAKDAVIGDFRRKNRDLELEKARMQGELEARKELQVEKKETPKSPLELAEAAYIEETGSLDGFAMSGALYRQQRDFDNAQTVTKTAAEKEEKSKSDMDRSVRSLQDDELSIEKMGDGLDFNSVVGLGQHYLDKADLLKIEIVSNRDGLKAAAKKAYNICKQAILDANNSDSKLLKDAISKSQTKPKVKPKKQTNIDALTAAGEDGTGEAETGTQTENQRLAGFVCGGGTLGFARKVKYYGENKYS